MGMRSLEPTTDLEDLYRQTRPQMVRLAYLLTGSTEVAEELVQEAFLKVWPRLGGVSDPAAYARAVVGNLAKGHHRRAAVAAKHPPVPPGPSLNPETDEIWNQLWLLPERQRAALVLRFYGDLDVAGVADALGCRLGTAKSLIHRGLSHLKEVIADD